MKKKTIINIETIGMALLFPPVFSRKKFGRVIDLYFSVWIRRSFARINHDKIIPPTQPIAVHISISPILNASPGKPNNNHADSPDALSEKEITHGFNFLPAII